MDYWKSSIQRLFITFLSIIVLLLAGRIFFFLDYLPTDFWGKASWFEVMLVFLSATRFDVSTASAVIFTSGFRNPFAAAIFKEFEKTLENDYSLVQSNLSLHNCTYHYSFPLFFLLLPRSF